MCHGRGLTTRSSVCSDSSHRTGLDSTVSSYPERQSLPRLTTAKGTCSSLSSGRSCVLAFSASCGRIPLTLV